MSTTAVPELTHARANTWCNAEERWLAVPTSPVPRCWNRPRNVVGHEFDGERAGKEADAPVVRFLRVYETDVRNLFRTERLLTDRDLARTILLEAQCPAAVMLIEAVEGIRGYPTFCVHTSVRNCSPRPPSLFTRSSLPLPPCCGSRVVKEGYTRAAPMKRPKTRTVFQSTFRVRMSTRRKSVVVPAGRSLRAYPGLTAVPTYKKAALPSRGSEHGIRLHICNAGIRRNARSC
jgi:hypothetical protein